MREGGDFFICYGVAEFSDLVSKEVTEQQFKEKGILD
jgi:hypothetical protein